MIEIFIASLAAWRLSYMLAAEEGPWRVFFYLKDALGAYDYGPDGEPKTWYGRGIKCAYCISFWAALLFSLPILAEWRYGWLTLAVPFAVSAGAMWLNRMIRRE